MCFLTFNQTELLSNREARPSVTQIRDPVTTSMSGVETNGLITLKRAYSQRSGIFKSYMYRVFQICAVNLKYSEYFQIKQNSSFLILQDGVI